MGSDPPVHTKRMTVPTTTALCILAANLAVCVIQLARRSQ